MENSTKQCQNYTLSLHYVQVMGRMVSDYETSVYRVNTYRLTGLIQINTPATAVLVLYANEVVC